MAYISPVLWWC